MERNEQKNGHLKQYYIFCTEEVGKKHKTGIFNFYLSLNIFLFLATKFSYIINSQKLARGAACTSAR